MNLGSTFNLFCPYQLAWMREQAGMAFGEKSRRIGWTYADAFNETINRVGPKPTYPYDAWYSATDRSAAEEYMGYVADFASLVKAVATVSDDEIEVADDAGNVAKLSVMKAVFETGVKIVAGSSNPNFFRSKGGSVRLDELAFHRDGRAMFKAAHASARFWGFPLRAWSSHHGPGSYFNTLITQARAGKLKAAVHRVTILDAVEQGIAERVRMRRDRLADVPPVDTAWRKEWLDTLRAECPDVDVWNEEYLCIPSSDAGSFLDYELLRACEVQNLQQWQLPTGEAPWPDGREVYVGADVAVRNDLFVVWALERVGDVYWTRLVHAKRGVTFAEIEETLDRVMAGRSVRRLCMDKTGMGEQLAERLRARHGYRFEPVHFTGPVKLDLAMPLRRAFEDRKVRTPAEDAVREDLHSVRKYVTAAGNIRFDVEESDATDSHADRFWALALAYHAAGALKVPPPRPAMKPIDW